MLIRDALYGAFTIPSFLKKLILAPEFRRLSEIRLININSPSLSALAEVRRYSHTLGVLRLALLNPLMGLREEELRAFLASIIVHDAGTPAFAHLFEYFLTERYAWNHEAAIPELLRGDHHPDKHAHQIHASQTLMFEKLCGKVGIDFDLVLDFVGRKHPYSSLIFGSLDFDNIDNVARMNWMLGERFEIEPLLSIANKLSVHSGGKIELPLSERANVLAWLELRSRAYSILVFDGPTVAGQAVLSRAISEALDASELDANDWHYNDYTFMGTLSKIPNVKKRLDRDFVKALPELSLLHVETRELARFDAIGRSKLTRLVEEFLNERLNKTGTYGYVFRDRGTFSKTVDFVDPTTGLTWSAGDSSASLIIYGFARGRAQKIEEIQRIGREFREWAEPRI